MKLPGSPAIRVRKRASCLASTFTMSAPEDDILGSMSIYKVLACRVKGILKNKCIRN